MPRRIYGITNGKQADKSIALVLLTLVTLWHLRCHRVTSVSKTSASEGLTMHTALTCRDMPLTYTSTKPSPMALY